MNVIDFKDLQGCVDIRIDGERLQDIMKAVELPMATREGSPELAGDYRALTYQAGMNGRFQVRGATNAPD